MSKIIPLRSPVPAPEQGGLDAYDLHTRIETDSIAYLAAVWSRGLTVEELQADGKSPARAHSIKRAAHVLFGPTKYKKLQRLIREKATDKHLSVDQLCVIIDQLRLLHNNTNPSQHHVHKVLYEILQVATGWVTDMKKQTTQVIREHNQAIQDEKDAAHRAAVQARKAAEAEQARVDAENQRLTDEHERKERQRLAELERQQTSHNGEANTTEDNTDIGEGAEHSGGELNDQDHSDLNTPIPPPRLKEAPELPVVPEPFQPPQGRVWVNNDTDAAGERSMTVTGPEAQMNELGVRLERAAKQIRQQRPELSLAEARFIALTEPTPAKGQARHQAQDNLASPLGPASQDASTDDKVSAVNGEAGKDLQEVHGRYTPVRKPQTSDSCPKCSGQHMYQPVIVYGSNVYQEFKAGDPSEETLNSWFGSTDGTIRSGKELAKLRMGPDRTFIHLDWENKSAQVFITRPHQAHDDSHAALEKTLTQIRAPLDLGTLSRAPNAVIRTIVDALYLQCVWPGCSKPGMFADYHHIVAAKHEGPTSVWNLTKLCPHHNGRNDDDRHRKLNGYVFVDEYGTVMFQPPNDAPPVILADPITQYGALAVSRSRKLSSLQEALDVPVPVHRISDEQVTESSDSSESPPENTSG